MGDTLAKTLQDRWIAALTAIALTFGGIWLQNQWRATERLEQMMIEHNKFLFDNFMTRKEMDAVMQRIERHEKMLDATPHDHPGFK